MGYYDDGEDDNDDAYSSSEEDEEEEIFYHNYSVDYANQMLKSSRSFSSCVPLMRSKHRRRSPHLIRVATWDQMGINQRTPFHASLSSQRKFPRHTNDPLSTRLPSLQATSEELERRATASQVKLCLVSRRFDNESFLSSILSRKDTVELVHRPDKLRVLFHLLTRMSLDR
jgi:hypothetical protein